MRRAVETDSERSTHDTTAMSVLSYNVCQVDRRKSSLVRGWKQLRVVALGIGTSMHSDPFATRTMPCEAPPPPSGLPQPKQLVWGAGDSQNPPPAVT